ncbi:MAG: hypothetical protein ABIH99_00600 [Candidatus Micrarchaeota archaeon]
MFLNRTGADEATAFYPLENLTDEQVKQFANEVILQAPNVTINSGNIKALREERKWVYVGSAGTYNVEGYMFYVKHDVAWLYSGEFEFDKPGKYNITFKIELPPSEEHISPEFHGHLGFVEELNISYNYLKIARQTLDPLDADTDDDSLEDGVEVEEFLYPLNGDPDEDGLSDAVELKQTKTNPEFRDSDYDGLRDSVELGMTGGDVDPYTVWDTYEKNIDADPSTKTDPLDFDSDNDGLADGWADGWGYADHNGWDTPKKGWMFVNRSNRQIERYEGEDFNRNGKLDANPSNSSSGVVLGSGDFICPAGGLGGLGICIRKPVSTIRANPLDQRNLGNWTYETDPLNEDTDGDELPDGWEQWYGFNPRNTSGVNGASGDVDIDSLNNLGEYKAATHPFRKDTDNDSLSDGVEAGTVILRTSVVNATNGFAYWAAAIPSDWIQFNGFEYVYTGDVAGTPEFFWRSWNDKNVYSADNRNRILIEMFEDDSYLFLNTSSNEMYICMARGHGCKIFSSAGAYGVYTGSFKGREIYASNPLKADTDGDGINDSVEPSWNADSDNDGLINARDLDSDGDWIGDMNENTKNVNDSINYEALDTDGDGLVDMVDVDSDADGLRDGDEEYGLYGDTSWRNPDSDGDGLLDGVSIGVSAGDYRLAYFTNHSISSQESGSTTTFIGELTLGTNNSKVDSDGDWLWDGFNSTMWDREWPGELLIETDPLNADSDGDGLSDGKEAMDGASLRTWDMDGVLHEKLIYSDPLVFDTDWDGLNDSYERRIFSDFGSSDTDGDGLLDKVEAEGKTDILKADTDGDGLPDGWIDLNGNGRVDPNEGEDANRNGVLDSWEMDPSKADTDGDGVDDCLEQMIVIYRTNAVNDSFAIEGYDDAGVSSPAVWIDLNTAGEEGGLARFEKIRPDGYSLAWLEGLRSSAVKLNMTTNSGLPIYGARKDPTKPANYYYHYSWIRNPYEYIFVGDDRAVDQLFKRDYGVKPTLHQTQAYHSSEKYYSSLSDPLKADTDGDGLIDGDELYNVSKFDSKFTSLLNVDGDAVNNLRDTDSDNDGILDAKDLWYDTNKSTKYNEEHPPGADWLPAYSYDFDGDGLPNALDVDSDADNITDPNEDLNKNGFFEPNKGETNPLGQDSDDDGIADSAEIQWGLDPNNPDVDYDGVMDGSEPQWSTDSDGDGEINALDPDSDGDLLLDGYNLSIEKNGNSFKYFNSRGIPYETEGGRAKFVGELSIGTKVLNPDSDNDGVWDGFDKVTNVSLNYPGATQTPSAMRVIKGELSWKLNPLYYDSDGDRLEDGYELNFETSGTPVYEMLTEVEDRPRAGYRVYTFVAERDANYTVNFTLSTPAMLGYFDDFDLKIKLMDEDDALVNYTRRMEYYGGSDGAVPGGGEYYVQCIYLPNLKPGVYRLHIIMPDYAASKLSFSPLLVRTALNPLSTDTDGDSLSDYRELHGVPYQRAYEVTGSNDRNTAAFTNPMKKDSDDDGIDDPTEAALGLDPTNPDTDFDGVWDGNDYMPVDRVSYSSYYKQVLPVDHIRPSMLFRVWGISGHTYKYECGLVKRDLGKEGTKNSDMSDDNMRSAIRESLSGQEVMNLRTMVDTGGRGTEDPYVWERWDFLASQMICAVVKFEVVYTPSWEVQNVTLYNRVPTALPDAAGNYFYHITKEVAIAQGRANDYVFQVSFRNDRYSLASEGNYVLPVFIYGFYKDETLVEEKLVYQNIAVGAPLDNGGYQLTVELPKEYANNSSLYMHILPVWMENKDGVMKRYTVGTGMEIAALRRELPENAYSVLGRKDVNLTDMLSKLPDNVGAYGSGSQTAGGYSVYVVRTSSPASINANKMYSSQGVIFIGESEGEVNRWVESYTWPGTWYTIVNDGMQELKVYNRQDVVKKRIFQSAALSRFGDAIDLNENTANWKSITEENTITVRSVEDVNLGSLKFQEIETSYAVKGEGDKTFVEKGFAISKSAANVVESMEDSGMLKDAKYDKLRGTMSGVKLGVTLVTDGQEAVIAWKEGDVTKASYYSIKTGAGVIDAIWGEKSVAKVGGKSVKVLHVIRIVIGVVDVGYNIYLLTQTHDPFLEKYYYENIAMAVTGTVLTFVPYVNIAQAVWSGAYFVVTLFYTPDEISARVYGSMEGWFVTSVEAWWTLPSVHSMVALREALEHIREHDIARYTDMPQAFVEPT